MKKIGSLGIVLAILVIVLPALAADRKAFHGAICQPAGFAPLTYGDGAVGGEDGSYALCPLIRDRMESSTSLGQVAIEFIIPNPGSALCTLWSQDEDSSAGSSVDSDSAENNNTGIEQLTMSVDSSSGNEGSYSVFCDLSEGTKLLHIYISESTTAAE